jgi:hypothetical protein
MYDEDSGEARTNTLATPIEPSLQEAVSNAANTRGVSPEAFTRWALVRMIADVSGHRWKPK